MNGHTVGLKTSKEMPGGQEPLLRAKNSDGSSHNNATNDRAPGLGQYLTTGGDANKVEVNPAFRTYYTPCARTEVFLAAPQTRRDHAMAPVKKPSHAGKAVVAGGISGAVEICCTYPVSRLDLRLHNRAANATCLPPQRPSIPPTPLCTD